MGVMAAALMLTAMQDAAVTAARPAPAPEVKKICRREVSTASRLDVKRTCRTRAEWDALDRDNGGSYRRDLDRSRGTSAG